MERNVKTEAGGDRQRHDEEAFHQWCRLKAMDNVRVKERDTERQREIVFFFLPLRDYCSRGGVITGAPSLWRRRDTGGRDAGCMLIKLNTNWSDRKEEKKRPPFQLQPSSPSSSLWGTRLWWALIKQWLARFLTKLHKLHDFGSLSLSVWILDIKSITSTVNNYAQQVICISMNTQNNHM